MIIYGSLVSIIPFLGTVVIYGKKFVNIKYIVSFASGAFLSVLFFNIFPRISTNPNSFKFVFAMFVIASIIEEFLHWHHHDDKHSIGFLNIVGDTIHNFIDGLALVSAFSISESLGLTILLSIIFHEIPQEIGDVGVLIYSGLSKLKALLVNFLFSFSTLIGIVVGYYSTVDPTTLLSISAGSMLYISTVDIIPLLKKELHGKEKILGFLSFILGVLAIYLTRLLNY